MAETALAEADKAARAALEASVKPRQAARAEERCDAANRRSRTSSTKSASLLDVEPAARRELAEIKAGAELPAIAERRKLDRIRRERERLGAVNLRAEEE